jgi:hypothetical protein
MKTVDALTEKDLRQHPVWQFVDNPAGDETSVRPIKAPVSSPDGKLVGAEVSLANGQKKWALIGSIDAKNPALTEHFLTLSLRHDSKWFHVARYHDYDAAQRGPEQLASFLGLAIDDVYPISYDIRAYVKGDPSSLCRSIPKAPGKKLTRAEIIALAVP